MILSLCLLVSLVILTHVYFKRHFDYWKRKGVPNPRVNYFFGNLAECVTLKKCLGHIGTQIYESYPSYRYVGFYKFRAPAVVIRDLDLIKSVLIRDFASFHDTNFHVDEKTDFILAKNLFCLKGQEWKVARKQLTSCFTSKKIKAVFPLMQESASAMVEYISRLSGGAMGKDGFHVEELMSKYTTENVASCAFGLNGNCFEDENAEFRQIGRKLAQPTFWLGLQHLLVMAIPSLANVLRASFFTPEITQRLTHIVKQTLEYRENNNVVRNDFLDFLNELKGKHDDFTVGDIIAHVAGFFGDGFVTSSVVLTFLVYEIAFNSEVQRKLQVEIDEVIEKHGGKFTYEGIQEMTYLDCVFWEGMRKNPPLYNLLRECTKEYALPPPLINDGQVKGPKVKIEPGTTIWIPIAALQNDEKYFSHPKTFDPDRFSQRNKDDVISGTLLGFGDGPRICLGVNFGVLQVKLAVANLLRNFDLKLNGKTQSPLELDPRFFMRTVLGGVWMDIFKRKK